VHPLDPSKTTYRAWGQGYTLPTFWVLCDSCESLYLEGDDDALVALMAAGSPSVRDMDEDVRKPVRVFRDADRGARRFAAPHPELVRLGAQGYEPLHAHTGAVEELGPIWPEAHRVALPPELEPDEDQRWLVRSPWPSITVREAIELIWSWVEWPPRDLSVGLEGAAEVLGWPEEVARERLAACRARRPE
jgi:hypothetical protein